MIKLQLSGERAFFELICDYACPNAPQRTYDTCVVRFYLTEFILSSKISLSITLA